MRHRIGRRGRLVVRKSRIQPVAECGTGSNLFSPPCMARDTSHLTQSAGYLLSQFAVFSPFEFRGYCTISFSKRQEPDSCAFESENCTTAPPSPRPAEPCLRTNQRRSMIRIAEPKPEAKKAVGGEFWHDYKASKCKIWPHSYGASIAHQVRLAKSHTATAVLHH